MANAEQLAILKQGVKVWNKWRKENQNVRIDLYNADLPRGIELAKVNFFRADLSKIMLTGANLSKANLLDARLLDVHFIESNLNGASLRGAILNDAILDATRIQGANFAQSMMANTIFANLDLSKTLGLAEVLHRGPSIIGTETFLLSRGKIPELFLRGCGLSDWEIEEVKLYDPDLSNEDVSKILYRIYDLRASQAIQISPLFISYSHADGDFINELELHLIGEGVRFWRDVHGMKAGRMEKQIDKAIRQNPIVLLVLSENSLASDWVEHEVRTARQLEKEMDRDMLCPIALDDGWKSSRWPKRIMEQIMEYNILDFSSWREESKFEGVFRKLIDGLELFYRK